MTPPTSQTRTTAPQRKATALRCALATAAAALVGVLALTPTADAQARGPRGVDPAPQVERLTEALVLTDAQAVELRALFDAQAEARPARGERGSGDRETMRAQREARRAEMDRQIEALLTPEQVERYRALRAEREGPRRGRRGDGR